MNPYTGEAFMLRDALLDGAEPGAQIAMDEFRRKVAELGEEATQDEVDAMRARALVAITEDAAQKLKLGARERERRRRRRKAASVSRRVNRA